MCEGMPWCATPYIQEEVIEPDCGMYSEWAMATISLHKRGVLTGQISGDFIAVEWMHEERAWSLWTACNMPQALASLLGPWVLGHDASGTACPSIAEMIMDSNVHRNWRAARGDDLEWVVPHTVRKTVVTAVERHLGLEAAARQAGHAGTEVTRRHYVERNQIVPDHTEALAEYSCRIRVVGD